MTTHEGLDIVVDTVAELLHLRIGLRPDQTLRGRLRRSIHEEASRHGQDPASFLERLVSDRDALQALLNRVTVQETGFFRHPEQFETLVRDILPTLRPPVRIWSAGCANGQEAYTLAMLLEEADVDGVVIATDLSTAALQRTRAASYARRELAGVSTERLARHFTVVGDRWDVATPVRDRVKTLHHNLLDPIPVEIHACQVVFCRNVLIYLSVDQVRLFLDRVADCLPPAVTLYVGAAETIWQASDRFRAVHLGGSFVYRRAPDRPVPRIQTKPEQPRVAAPGRRTGDGDLPSRRRGTTVVRPTPSAARRRAHPVAEPEIVDAEELERSAQAAFAEGDYDRAIVWFRKCAFLRPHDPMAQLHLGLALEANGDEPAARRAFAAARHVLVSAGPNPNPEGLEGYAAAELLRLLDSKR